jgi:hypothetical protein
VFGKTLSEYCFYYKAFVYSDSAKNYVLCVLKSGVADKAHTFDVVSRIHPPHLVRLMAFDV